ncbi:ring u-box domain-containing protein, partial [Nannochloropsis gaditana]
ARTLSAFHHLLPLLQPFRLPLLRAGQAALLLALWLLLLPLLVGLLFELAVILPARVPVDETPLIPLYEAWVLGLVFLKISVRCLLLGLLGNDHPWKRKFERVGANGFWNLDFTWTLRHVVLPVLCLFLSLLLPPYFFSKSVERLGYLYLRHVVLPAPSPPPFPASSPASSFASWLLPGMRKNRSGMPMSASSFT